MTEQPKVSSRPAGPRSWPWMIVSVVAIVALFGWLGASGRELTVAVVDEVDEAYEGGPAVAVTKAALAENLDAYMNDMIVVGDLEVVAPIGARLFWSALDNGVPFVVKYDEDAVIDGFIPETGTRVYVEGRVIEQSAEVLDEWEAAGVITDAGERMEAEFAAWFLDAVTVRPDDSSGS